MVTKNKNIVFLSAYNGVIYRGGETFVHELANNFVKNGYNVSVFQNGPKLNGSLYKTYTVDLPLKKADAIPGHPFVSKHAFFILRFTLKAIAMIPGNTDLVIPVNGGYQSILAKIWSTVRKRKIVISGQSGIGFDDRINLYTFPDAFVALTDEANIWGKRVNPAVVFHKIHNGVDTEKFTRRVKSNSKVKTVLCVAALEKQKQIDLVVRAVHKLRHVKLKIVGSGSQFKLINSLCAELLPGRYEITMRPHHLMPEEYKKADAFVFVPEHSESFGIVYVEAMASGLPVVAIDDAQRREIIGNAGLFISNPNDIDKLSECIEVVLQKDWGDKPQKQASKFDWKIIAKSYMDVFNKI